MPKRILAAILISLQLACAKVPPLPAGQLDVQFSGMWGKQPNMVIQKQPYPFLIRLVGFVPPEAFQLLVTSQYGDLIAQSPIKYQDPMQLNPVRHYQFYQVLTQESCNAILAMELKKSGMEGADGLSIMESSPQDINTILVRFTAKVVNIQAQTLASESYVIHVHCGSGLSG